VHGLEIGKSYKLKFYYGGTQFLNYNPAPPHEAVIYTFGGISATTPTLDVAAQSFSGWRTATATYTATSTSELLNFLATGPNDLVLLDGVSLNPVPEAGTVGLLGLGIGAIGVARRRK